MGEQVGVAPLERTQPVPDRFGMALEPFVLANRPPHDEGINRAEFGAKLRGIEPTVVADPSTEDGPYPGRYLFQLQVVAPMQSPTSHALPHSLGGLIAHRRKKAYEAFAVAVLRRPRPKRIAEKVEAALRVCSRGDLHHCSKRPWSFAGAVAIGTPQTSAPALDVTPAPEPRSDSGR